ncbi:type II secretion system protein [Desulfuromonas versatilis]|uniref:Type II secretion system protein n=1 Tax=Desulfuromonas versatilis TaxID=2802975 RepID=A0ABN6E0C5_9BACT|nr:type II secretion system F family protein [Desulfuromonas versatilis]BCR05770.1 type II secretion system protein [Desulfuromonas versatilis]
MPSFRCKIGTADGRVVEKEFDAVNQDLLRESLEQQGFHVFQVKKLPFQFLRGTDLGRGTLAGRRFLSFNQELLVLLRSGLPILQVLDTIIERIEPGTLLEVLREIRQDVKGGSALSETFGKYPKTFPHLYVASIKAGERTGDLPVTLGRYILYQKRVEALKAKVRGAAFYPALLTIAVIGVLLFMLLYVVPSFTQIYTDANVQLPLMTRMLIAVAEGLTGSLPLTLPLLVAGLVGVRIFLRSERGGMLFDRLKLKAPFFGKLLIDYALSSFCRTFGTTLSSGIPAVQAMQMSRGTLNNRLLESRLTRAIQRVEEGTAISQALEQTGFFPSIALRMIGVGETGGSLAEMLGDVAEYYEDEVARRLDRLTTLIEPMMMMMMGLLIGGIVVAMYVPIFQLAGTVR